MIITCCIHLLKVNNRNSRTRCEICSKLTIKIPEPRHWASFWYLYCYCYLSTYFTPCSCVSIVNFEHVIPGWVQIILQNETFKDFNIRSWTTKRNNKEILSGLYSKPCQASKMKHFVKPVNGFWSLIMFAKCSIIGVWQISEYVSDFIIVLSVEKYSQNLKGVSRPLRNTQNRSFCKNS